MDDETLAQHAILDRSAFAAIYKRYLTRIYRYQLARCGNPADAEDLCAQTFLAALENIHRFRGDGSFAAWLFGIARRKTALHHRSRRNHASLDDAEEHADPGANLEQITNRNILLQRVYAALGSLSTQRAEAVLLVIFANLSAAEAGAVLGKTPAAIKMAVSRGLNDLRQRLMWKQSED